MKGNGTKVQLPTKEAKTTQNNPKVTSSPPVLALFTTLIAVEDARLGQKLSLNGDQHEAAIDLRNVRWNRRAMPNALPDATEDV